MEKYSHFNKILDGAVTSFRSLVGKNVRLISHLDSDGICAASIMIKTLLREGINYSLSIVSQLKEDILKELTNEKYDVFIFTDLGSGQIELIDKYLPNKKIFIFDHHVYNNESNNPNLCHVNPHSCGINGSIEISGSGVVYKFAEKLNENNKDMSHIAIIGAIGDSQENEGFLHLNNEILNVAVKNNKINVENGLKFFGLETKPLFKVLAHSTEPIIRGVSGDDELAIAFLKEIKVNAYIGAKARKYFNLTSQEKEKLISELIIKRAGEKNPKDILGNIYQIIGEEDGSPTKDVREFSTLLNACGRLGKSSLGIGACLNDPNIKKEAILALTDYKIEIMNSLKWYESSKKDPEKVIKKPSYIILMPRNEVRDTMIGTLSSIIARDKTLQPNTFIMSLANQEDYSVKVSIRVANSTKEVDARSIIQKITNKIGGQSGGHKMAAGAIINPEQQNDFVNEAIKAFEEFNDKEILINEISRKSIEH